MLTDFGGLVSRVVISQDCEKGEEEEKGRAASATKSKRMPGLAFDVIFTVRIMVADLRRVGHHVPALGDAERPGAAAGVAGHLRNPTDALLFCRPGSSAGSTSKQHENW